MSKQTTNVYDRVYIFIQNIEPIIEKIKCESIISFIPLWHTKCVYKIYPLKFK